MDQLAVPEQRLSYGASFAAGVALEPAARLSPERRATKRRSRAQQRVTGTGYLAAILRAWTKMNTIDWSKPFMPEQLTPLYHTAIWRDLTGEQQLRYLQLNALYINEQILFFERAFAPNVLSAFMREPLTAHMGSNLSTFLGEEEKHSAMFWDLNRRCAPQWYSDSQFHFIQVPKSGRRLLEFITRRPRWFPLCLWLMLLQEDRALHYGRAYLR